MEIGSVMPLGIGICPVHRGAVGESPATRRPPARIPLRHVAERLGPRTPGVSGAGRTLQPLGDAARFRRNRRWNLVWVTVAVSLLALVPYELSPVTATGIVPGALVVSVGSVPSESPGLGDPSGLGVHDANAPADAVLSVPSDPDWVDITAGLSNQPSPRSNASAAWDAGDGEYLLVGGESGGVALGDTWAFKDGNWTQLTSSAGSPGARYGAGMAYDARDNYTVLFGGNNSFGTLGDTWAFSNGRWVHLTPSGPPRPRVFPAMQYDPAAAEVVMFGGFMLSNQSGATWGFSDGNWTSLLSGGAGEPADRVGAAMAYDAAAQNIVMFGGWDPATKRPIALNDTWVLVRNDSTPAGFDNWTQITTAAAPSARFDAAIAYDASEQKVVLFGGSTLQGVALGDTWLWNSTQWVRAPLPSGNVSPRARMGAAMAMTPSPGTFGSTTAASVFLFSGWGNNSALADDAWFFGELPLSVLPPITPSQSDVNIGGHLSVLAFGGNSTFYRYVWNGLPSGCSTVNLSTLTCAPDLSGAYSVSVTVSDSTGQSAASSATTWQVANRPEVEGFTISPAPSVVSEQVTVTVTAVGGTAPITYVYTGFPTGCPTQNSSTLDCYPQTTGTFKVGVIVTDADGQHAFGNTTLTVHSATPSIPALWQYLTEGLILLIIGIIVAALVRRNLKARRLRDTTPDGQNAAAPAGRSTTESAGHPEEPATVAAPSSNPHGPPAPRGPS